ncbi:hypothetical protein LJR220_001709 [Bradyrhizobium sp. LjRoot220]|uniref:hypothetical protein n=1 Tax=Bradyrhizobium sp. LjRoot220 TaxID=3342284 RepID=UPI003ECC6205
MPRVLRQDISLRTHHDWAVPVVVGVAVACLLCFLAFYPKAASHASSAGPAETVGLAAAKPEPVAAAKRPVRYEATIENWKRYRAATKPAE